MRFSSLMIFTCLLSTTGMSALTPAAHPLFDGDAVHEIHLNFAEADWFDILTDNYENFDDPPYLEASFSWNEVELETIGVRFKGNSSYWSYYGEKKSFKLDIDEFVDGQEIYGLDKLNLNNCFLDASYVREKCAYELCAAMGMPVSRTNYAAVYINDELWGLYLLVEQPDQEFLESRFGQAEAGNQWKGEPYGSLEYLGDDESLYYDDYELKSNEEINDWSALVDLVDALNNSSVASLRDSLHNRVDINSALAMLAIDNFMVNLDSYIGRCANYYFYHRDLDDRVVFFKWDMNEAFGVFNLQLSLSQLISLDPYWSNPQPGANRPLATRLLELPAFQSVYEGHMKKLMAGPAQPETLLARMEELRDLIRPWVQIEPYCMFTPSQFEQAITADVYADGGPPPGRLIPGLANFIESRHDYLVSQIGSWSPVNDLVINELVASNDASYADEAGEYDDWIEILNRGDTAINLSGFGLTDHFEGYDDYLFPDITLEAGARLIIWADEDEEQGEFHAPFKLGASGEDLYLTLDGVIVDMVSWPSLASDQAWGRFPDGSGEFIQLAQASPGEVNTNQFDPETVTLFVNEFLASNDTGITDETGAAEDWLEIWNPGPDDVNLGGLFLSDDLADSTKWILPDTLLPAGEFLLVWCDDDPDDGPLHTTFKLSASGEAVAIFGSIASGSPLIDGYTFGEQATDISEGRSSDGSNEWIFFESPTPGASNSGLSVSDPAGTPDIFNLGQPWPNPFNPVTQLELYLPLAGEVQLALHDLAGRRLDHWSVYRLAGTSLLAIDLADRPSGIYYLHATVGQTLLTRKLLLVK